MSRTHLYFALFYLLVGMTVMALSFSPQDIHLHLVCKICSVGLCAHLAANHIEDWLRGR